MTPSHPGAAPYSLGPIDAPRVALFHGLTGTPAELWPLGVALAAAGYHVDAPLWEGHGNSPEALARVSGSDLIEQARRIARAPDSPEVFVGLSMGALLAIIAAAESKRARALVLMAPAIVLKGPNGVYQRLAHIPGVRRSNRFISKPAITPMPADPIPVPRDLPSPLIDAAHAALKAETAPFSGRYARLPLRWSYELAVIREEARWAAARVRIPTLLLHGGQDSTSSIESCLEVARWLGGECRLRVFPGSPHVMPLGPERGAIAAEVVGFLGKRSPRASQSA